tara:strand:+ start:4355 stop:5446 length:1092 start_codon:yes stop_codon:yes gene_type:complete
MIFLKRTKMKPLTVYSMFDGISCGRIALERAGLPVKQYFTSEIDKYASAISRCNWNTTELGDITKVNFNDLPKLSLILCGAPCQDLSFAGYQKGFAEGTRSSLFFKLIECLENQEKRFGVKPKFIVEQVKMKKENLAIMENLLGVKGVMINSSNFSAQNRQRYYFCNFEIPEYQDKGILLKDILEDGYTDREKSHCIDANYFKGGNLKSYFEKHRRQLVFTGGAFRGRYNKDGSTSQKLEIRKDSKSNALTTVRKDSLCIQIGEADLKGYDAIKRVYSAEGKAPTLTTCGGGHREPKVYVEPLKWRKLTPRECEALQTVPRDYTAHGAEVGGKYKKISNTRRYHALGNGWTVDVIAHLLKGLI